MKSLMIPMLVEAYAAGRIRPEQKKTPVIAPNYVTALRTSVLGQKNTPDIAKKGEALECGIHLHFILPDAFTHSPDGIDFPAVPNRYIVTRMFVDPASKKLVSKSFIVESDFISTEKTYNKSVSIPFFHDVKKPWRYLGRNYPAGSMKEDGAHLEKLTAVGAGDVFFSSYYPNCRSVFGFYDDLSDLPVSASADLTYFVAGYYAERKNDPFANVNTIEDFQAALARYRFSVKDPGQLCQSCVLYGAVELIEWKGEDAGYCPAPAGKVKVVLGNTSAEAFSRAISKNFEEEQFDETLLTALQYELYDELNEPDGNFKIDDEIHAQSFQGLDGGDLKKVLVVGDGEAPDVAAAFSSIQEQGCRCGDLKRCIAYERGKLYSVWEQYVLLYEEADGDIKGYPSRADMTGEIERLCAEVERLEQKLQTQKDSYDKAAETLKHELPSHVKLEETGADKFFAAKDPVLLLYGDGVNRSFAFGEDGRFTANGTLFCQTSLLLPDAEKSKLFESCFVRADRIETLPEFDDLILQTVLLCGNIRKTAERIVGNLSAHGEQPCEIALNQDPFNWTTLFMMWKAEYRPTRTDKHCDNTLLDWRFVYGDTNLSYQGNRTPETIPDRYSCYGRAPLIPHAVKTFSSVVKRYSEIYGEEEQLKELAEKIGALSVISQSLGGFTDCLSGFIPALQFPVTSMDGDDKRQNELAGRVSRHIGLERRSITTEREILAMRGGYVRITSLTLVGSFGQTQPLIYESYLNDTEIDFAKANEYSKDYAVLPPCFAVPARLNAGFVLAGEDRICASPAAKATPVQGIVIPEMLNRRLLIYSAGGAYMGMVKTVYRNQKPQARWISAPGKERVFETLLFEDSSLKGFVAGLLKGNAFFEFNALMDRYLDHKECLDQLIWGRPLALARAKLSLEFFGKPQFSKKYDQFKQYSTLKAEEIRVELKLGDIQRLTDGLLGYFDDNDFSRMFPPFGAENPNQTEEYVQYEKGLDLSHSDGGRLVTLLTAPSSPVYIQTGILPVQKISMDAAHVKDIADLPLTAEISPILAGNDSTDAPFPRQAGESGYQWLVQEKEGFRAFQITPSIAAFHETMLTDGYIMKKVKEQEDGEYR